MLPYGGEDNEENNKTTTQNLRATFWSQTKRIHVMECPAQYIFGVGNFLLAAETKQANQLTNQQL